MILKFTKMHGLGNDFVVINGLEQQIILSNEQIKQLADRHFGIGFDQLLIILPSDQTNIDFNYRIFNADGTEAQQCGNGVRCIVRYLVEHNYTNKQRLYLASQAGVMEIELKNKDFEQICANMGQPTLDSKAIPLLLQETQQVHQPNYILPLYENDQRIMAVSMGNPHAIVLVDDINTASVNTLGPRIGKHQAFPEGVNVGFMQVIDQNQIKLRVFERGVGETLACGTGACAAVVVGIINAMLDNTVTVILPGGNLTIQWQGANHPVYMTGAAIVVYEGTVNI